MSLITNNKQKHEYKGVGLPFALIRFLKFRKWSYLFSFLLTTACFVCIFTKGFNWGLDFTGGVVIDTHFSQPANLDSVRTTLDTNGINSAIVQTTGSTSDVMIRLPATISDAH